MVQTLAKTDEPIKLTGVIDLKIRETTVGLIIPENISFDEWMSYAPRFDRASDRLKWCFGDYLAFGERIYGETYAQACDATGYDVETVRKLMQVSNNVKIGSRRPDLSWSHHQEVAFLKEADQNKWLTTASEKKLSKFELRQSIKAGKVLTQQDIDTISGKASGIATVEGVTFWFNRWKKRVEQADPFDRWEEHRLRLLQQELRPIVQFYQKIDSLLDGENKSSIPPAKESFSVKNS